MSIHDVVLFVSSTSQACVPPVQFIRQNQLPARLVRLDTAADRQAAAQGQYFQIQGVPTLLVTYSDGNIQLFAGQEKSLMWLQQAVQAQRSQQGPPSPPIGGGGSVQPDPGHVTTLIEDSDDDEDVYEEPRRRKKKPSPAKPKGKRRSKKKSKSAPSPKGSGGLYGGKPRRKKKPPVQFEDSGSEGSDDEGGIVFVDDGSRPSRPPAPPTAGLMVGPASQSKRKSQMTSLYDIAKQMEKDRQSTLGYREEDLPVGT